MKYLLAGLILLSSTNRVWGNAPTKLTVVATIRSTQLTTPPIAERTRKPHSIPLEPGVILTVEHDEGDKIWVNDVLQAGYVPRQDVLSLPEARILFSEQIAQHRFSGDSYVYRGNVLLALKEFNSAHRDFSEGILREARNLSAAYVGRALAQQKLDIYADIRPNPDDQGNPDAAPGEGEKETSAPKSPPAPKTKDPVLEDLREALRIDRRNPRVLLARAQFIPRRSDSHQASPESAKPAHDKAQPEPTKTTDVRKYLDEAIRWNPLSAQAFAERSKYPRAQENPLTDTDSSEATRLTSRPTCKQPQSSNGLSHLDTFAGISIFAAQSTVAASTIPDVQPWLNVLDSELKQYQDAIQSLCLRRIVFCERIAHPEIPDPAGLFEKETNTIYFKADLARLSTFSRTIHHELFHAIYARFPDRQLDDAWQTFHRKADYIGRAKAHGMTDHPQDFVTAYAMSAPEEDMAETYAYLKSKDKGIASPNAVLTQKIERLKEFLGRHVDLSKLF